MKKLKITEKNITLKTFENIVKQREKEFKCNDIDILALQFMSDVATVGRVSGEISEHFFNEFGNGGSLSQSKSARNFVHYVLHGEKIY